MHLPCQSTTNCVTSPF